MKKLRVIPNQFDSDRNFADPQYKKWRQAVYKRDGWHCQMPECRLKGRTLHAHHIQRWADQPSLRFLVSNGITLCSVCHKKATGHEESYQSLFTGIALKNGSRGNSVASDFRLRMLLNRYGQA